MQVLIIEDTAALAEALARGLEAEGYAVATAGDGITGLAMARHGDFDLVLLDLMLPGLSGYQVCTDLRRAGSRVPILVLSAKDGPYDQADALDAGADDFVTKPFSYVVLLAHVRALLRRGRGGREHRWSVGDLDIDAVTRSCTRGETPIALGPTEFALLELLATREGAVVAKDELLAAFWTPDADPNVVEARIAAVRRKIDTPFGRESLRTVRGHGYRLVDDTARRS